MAGPFGWYDGLPSSIALEADGRSAHLLAPLTYHDPDGIGWPVPIGARLDGASIPRLFWTLIGGPLDGKYRDASIVHDHYCITQSRTWRHTHSMFHEAMRCSGVSAALAGVMYYAVYRFGPRWSAADALEAVAGRPAEAFDARTAESFQYDAEAIIRHGLAVPAIAALAEVRAHQLDAGGVALEGVADTAARPSRVQLVVVPGGSGTPDDVSAVIAGAAQMPDWMVDHFLAREIRIIACRGSVTDFESELRGVVPRGWEGLGRTWDSVPGTYFDSKRRVVIATIDRAGARVVPDKNSGLHGSDDVVVHESLHGYDYSTRHVVLAAPAFLTARDADAGNLPDYEKQAGQAGLEETFAETGAQYFRDRAAMAARFPALAGFWDTMPISSEGPVEPLPADAEPAALGVVSRNSDGSLVFDLRAIGEGGAIGHAGVTITADEPQHAALDAKLFPSRTALEAVASEPQPVLYFGPGQ
ncbi:MAG: DUF1353 domain-containing protein [Sphingomonas bacterium]